MTDTVFVVKEITLVIRNKFIDEFKYDVPKTIVLID